MTDPRRRIISLSLWGLVCLVSLIASISTAPILIYNTCPVLHKPTFSNVTCDNTGALPTSGTICNLSCTEGYPSSGGLTTECSWTGTWSNPSFGCSTPSLLIMGMSYAEPGKDDQLLAELYNPDTHVQTNVTIPPLPHWLKEAASGYIDGEIVVCGGYDVNKHAVTSSCYIYQENSWIKSAPLPEERYGAASAVILDGTALWVLAGGDKNDYGNNKTMILQHGRWRWGPDVTRPRVYACAVTLRNGDVILSGGGNGLNNTNSATVEKFSFKNMSWGSLPPLQQPRYDHRCAHVYLRQNGDIDTRVRDNSVSTVIVAGGITLDSSGQRHPVTSVELLVANQWILLPQLPTIHHGTWTGVMSLPTSLQWMPSTSLVLAGGCWMDHSNKKLYCTPDAWRLMWDGGTLPHFKYHWKKFSVKLDTGFYNDNTALSVPWNFFK